ncbi:PucR family transcriptional regulator [Nocardia sp. NPDC055321]
MSEPSRPTPRAAGERARVVARMTARTDAIAAAIAQTTRERLPAYAALSETTITGDTTAIVDRILTALSGIGALTADDVRNLRKYGEVRARQGISLIDVQTGWRIALIRARAELTAAGRACRASDRTLLELTHDLLDIIDEATHAYTSGHHDVELDLTRRDHQARAEFTRGLLLGTLTPADLRIRAQQYGLDLQAEYRAFRAHASTHPVVDAELRHRSRATPGAPVFTTTIDGDVAGFRGGTALFEFEDRVGYGPPARLSELDHSFRLAGRLLATARAFDLDGPIDLERAGLLTAVIADTDVGTELTRRYLDPLGDAEQARTLIETTESFLDTGMRFETTAERLGLHPNTIRYRIGRFEELAGIDLKSANTALRVWWAIKHRRAALRP